MGALLSIFWGLVLFSFLVFIHEGGHYLAARMFGVRVLEFFIGLPSRARLSWRSRKRGTRFGVTALLLGGYAAIAGMDMGKQNPHLALAMTLVNARGRITVKEAAYAMGIPYNEALSALMTLKNWGSIEECASEPTHLDLPISNLSEVEELEAATYRGGLPIAFQSTARDHEGKTAYDDPDFSKPGATLAGEPYLSGLSADEFLAKEKKRTYSGLSIPKRIVVLCAGVFVNIAFAILLFVGVFTIHGINAIDNRIDTVLEGSTAAQAGVVRGDVITKVGDTPVHSWEELVAALAAHKDKGDFTVTYEHDGVQKEFTAQVTEDKKLGITPQIVNKRLSVKEAFEQAGMYTIMTGKAVANLLNPAKVQETLSQSTSVVGISVLAKDAASAGPLPLITLAAAISLSLGVMNLLPIPPLDGGKVVIEIVQGITRRPVSERFQLGISYAGVALMLVLFIYLVGQDVMRLMFPH